LTQRDPLAVALAEMLFSNLKEMGKTVWLDVHMTKCARAGCNYNSVEYEMLTRGCNYM
jgi:hypothetical protein